MTSIEPSGQTPARFTDEQRSSLHVHGADQDRTLAAVHRLEAALASAAPHRRAAWQRDVLAALDDLAQATREEEANAARPESLLSDLARNQPRLRHRVHGLRAQYRHVRETIITLQQELVGPRDDIDVGDIRQRLSWLLAALRHQRARESDLIYEAFFDAFNHDLRSGEGR